MTDDNPEDQSTPDISDEGPHAPSGGDDGEAKNGEAKNGEAKNDEAKDEAKDAEAKDEAKDGEAKDEASGAESADAGKDREPSPPQQLLDALQDEIDETRRRLDVSGSGDENAEDGEEDKAFIEEGERDEDEPVDDTIAPPG